MKNDVAVFLDIDNLVIGAKQAQLIFDIEMVLQEIKKRTNGRIVYCRAYGDQRQSQKLFKELSSAGFHIQLTVALNNYGKNLADIQIVVDALETMIDGHDYQTYVLITGDRDFSPVVQALRKRGKYVIGVGVKHTVSDNLVELCDEYLYYKDILPEPLQPNIDIANLIERALDELATDGKTRVRASILKQKMTELSQGEFNKEVYANKKFTQFLEEYSQSVMLETHETTIYVSRPRTTTLEGIPLHAKYRATLKKLRLRVVPFSIRFFVLKDMIALLQQGSYQWKNLVDTLVTQYQTQRNESVSKNLVNSTLLVARKANVIQTLDGDSLSEANIKLCVNGKRPLFDAVVACDLTYLKHIRSLGDTPFDLREAALALYDDETRESYLQAIAKDGSSLAPD